MKVRHLKSKSHGSLASVGGDKFYYRTEVTNTNEVMREQHFRKWYEDAEDKDSVFSEGWLLPGKTAACDPDWNFGTHDSFYRAKWAFIAVDASGETYFDEAEVSEDVVTFHSSPAAQNDD